MDKTLTVERESNKVQDAYGKHTLSKHTYVFKESHYARKVVHI